jgi:hypothetical protein
LPYSSNSSQFRQSTASSSSQSAKLPSKKSQLISANRKSVAFFSTLESFSAEDNKNDANNSTQATDVGKSADRDNEVVDELFNSGDIVEVPLLPTRATLDGLSDSNDGYVSGGSSDASFPCHPSFPCIIPSRHSHHILNLADQNDY